MMKIGITGGIGSGKSTVCGIFKNLGVPVFNSDEAARKLVNENKDVNLALRAAFGDDMFFSDGNLDRKRLAKLVFNNPPELEKLNAIIHPLVYREFNKFCEEHKKAKYVVKEAAILFETKVHQHLDKIINVYAPREMRIERVLKREENTRENIERIMRFQLPDEEKNRLSDYIIVNENIDDLLPQVMEIHEFLLNEK